MTDLKLELKNIVGDYEKYYDELARQQIDPVSVYNKRNDQQIESDLTGIEIIKRIKKLLSE